MVSTRAGGSKQPGEASQSVNKRSAPSKAKPVTKKAKKEKDGKLQVGNGGEVGLKQDDKDDEHKGDGNEENNKDGEVEVDRSAAPVTADDKDPVTSDKEDEELGVKRSGPGETRQEVGLSNGETAYISRATRQRSRSRKIPLEQSSTSRSTVSLAPAGLELNRQGTLESGHIYFMYRPKIDADEVEGIDDISKSVLPQCRSDRSDSTCSSSRPLPRMTRGTITESSRWARRRCRTRMHGTKSSGDW